MNLKTTQSMMLAALFAACTAAQAQTPAPAAAPAPAASPFAFNLGVVTDYRFRGISQSRLKPALQGGVDWTHHDSGFYLGFWFSSIRILENDIAALLGDDIAKKVGRCNGVDPEYGEYRTMSRPTAQPHLWLINGGIPDSHQPLLRAPPGEVVDPFVPCLSASSLRWPAHRRQSPC